MSFLPAAGLFALFVFIAVAIIYKNKDKNSRIYNAKLRSDMRAESTLLAARTATPNASKSLVNTLPGMAIIESDDLTDSQYALVKLIFDGKDNIVKQQEDHWKNVRETRRFK